MKNGTSRPATRDAVARRYPRVVAHIIAESLGYATPATAALILFDAIRGKENWCEWIYSCYARDPRKAVAHAIEGRHRHTGYMAEFQQALALVRHYNATGRQPEFASWF